MAGPLPPRELDVARLAADALRVRGARLAFPPPLEARFEADTGAERGRTLVMFGLMGLAVYDLFLAIDFVMLRDIFPTVLLFKLGIVTPLGLGAAFWVSRAPPPRLREALATACVVIAAAVIGVIYGGSADAATATYVDTMMLYVVYSNVIMRLRHRAAVLTTCGIFVIEAAQLASAAEGPAAARASKLAMLCIVAGFTLFANHLSERAERRTYLLMLRETLRGSDLAARNAYLLDISATDGLTGVANRRAFDERTARIFAACARDGAAVGLLLIDIDHFKAFNDTRGHLAGDDCLREVARELQARARAGDLVARYGGEEFTVVLPGITAGLLSETAEGMRAAVEALGAGAHPVTISIGAALAEPLQGDTPAAILERADAALYEAKRSGRNAVRPLALAARPGRAGGQAGGQAAA